MSSAEPDLQSRFSRHKRAILKVMQEVEFRLATPHDAREIAVLFQTFFSEAGYKDRGIRYSLEKAEKWLEGVIANGVVPHVVAVCRDQIVGAISYSLDGTFCEEPVAVLHMFYVLKEHRRSAIGRVLAAMMGHLAGQDGACAVHAPLAGEMSESQSLVNLFAHDGYTPIGVILGRKI
jgi:L-amino acid N-acyltransferase YncA